MDDSSKQTFASEYFSHSQIYKITRILQVSSPGDKKMMMTKYTKSDKTCIV